MNIVVGTNGTLTFIYDDTLVGLMAEGEADVKRASHVEPAIGGTGWEADMRPAMGDSGPVLRAADGAPFSTRAAALAAEVDYLNREVLHVNPQC